MKDRPRILLFTGDGKGKTTAALGMALRASGHGLRTLIIQFVKADSSTGELAALGKLPEIELVQTGLGFLPEADDPHFTEHCEAARRGLSRAAEAINSGAWQLIILDEVGYAVHRGLLSEPEVSKVVEQAQPECCIVLTGRGATAGLIALADTVTDMRCVKHAHQAGRQAEKGVEF